MMPPAQPNLGAMPQMGRSSGLFPFSPGLNMGQAMIARQQMLPVTYVPTSALPLFDKSAISMWRTPQALKSIFARFNPNRTAPASATGLLSSVKQTLTGNAALPGLAAKMQTFPQTQLNPQRTASQLSASPSLYRGTAHVDPTVVGPAFDGLAHASPQLDVARGYGIRVQVPGQSELSYVNRFPSQPGDRFFADYGSQRDPGHGVTAQQFLGRGGEDLYRNFGYETSFTGRAPTARYLTTAEGAAHEIPYGAANDSFLRDTLQRPGSPLGQVTPQTVPSWSAPAPEPAVTPRQRFSNARLRDRYLSNYGADAVKTSAAKSVFGRYASLFDKDAAMLPPAQPNPSFQNTNRFGGLFPFSPGLNMGQAMIARQTHPNPAAKVTPPVAGTATAQGAQQALAKLSAFFEHEKQAANISGLLSGLKRGFGSLFPKTPLARAMTNVSATRPLLTHPATRALVYGGVGSGLVGGALATRHVFNQYQDQQNDMAEQDPFLLQARQVFLGANIQAGGRGESYPQPNGDGRVVQYHEPARVIPSQLQEPERGLAGDTMERRYLDQTSWAWDRGAMPPPAPLPAPPGLPPLEKANAFMGGPAGLPPAPGGPTSLPQAQAPQPQAPPTTMIGNPPAAVPASPPPQQPGMPPQQQQQPGAPAPMQAPTAPMTDAPPPSLPVNPRMFPPQPPNPANMQQNTEMQGMFAAKAQSELGGPADMQAQAMGMGDKMAGFAAKCAFGGFPFLKLAKIRTSASGDSKLRVLNRPDDYMQGQDAWAATGKYLHSGSKIKEEPNPFAGEHAPKMAEAIPDVARGFLAQCLSRGLTRQQIKQAIDKASQQFPEAEAELRDGFEKLAGGPMSPGILPKLQGWGRSAGRWLGNLWGHGGAGAAGAAANEASAVSGAAGAASRAAPRLPGPGAHPSAVPPVAAVSGTAPLAEAASSGWGHAGLRLGGGAVMGGFGGDAAVRDVWGDDAPWWARAGGAIGGAVAMQPGTTARIGRNPTSWGSPVLRSAQSSLLGSSLGAGLDETANEFGWANHPRFSRFGALAGLGIGAGRGIARRNLAVAQAANPGANFAGISAAAPYSRNMNNATRTLESGMNDMSRGLFDPTVSAFRGAANTGHALLHGFDGRAPLLAANGITSGLGGMREPAGWARMAGRALGVGGMAAGGLYAANNYIGNQVRRHGQDLYNQILPQAIEHGDQWMQSRGLTNEQGQIDPLHVAARSLRNYFGGSGQPGQGPGILQHADGLFRAIGMDPAHMSPLQKLMLLGGAGVGAGGAVAGSPVLAGMGGAGVLAGLLPHLMAGSGQNPQGNAPGGPGATPGAGNRPQQAAAPREDEFALQRRLYNS